MNELATHLIDVITSAREDWEGEQSAGSHVQRGCFEISANCRLF